MTKWYCTIEIIVLYILNIKKKQYKPTYLLWIPINHSFIKTTTTNKQTKIIGSQFLTAVCSIVVDYQLYPASDLPGKFDYRCRLSLSGSGCTRSAYDVMEASTICDADPECRGFVVSKQTTWSGNVGCCMVFKDYN